VVGYPAQPLLNHPTMRQRPATQGGMRKARGESGFTVVELSIVMAVLALASTLAVLSYRDTLPTTRLREATTDLFTAISLARVSALSQGSTMTVQLVGSGTTVSGTDVTVTGTSGVPIGIQVTSAAGAMVLTQPLSTEVVQVTVSPGAGVPVAPRVQFNAYGLHVGGNTQILTLTNTKGKIYSINVGAGGKSKFCLAPACP
jgi:prepilin-type N-terminal cleavage/methylation domain-containing protein